MLRPYNPTHRALLSAARSLLATHCSLLTAHCPSITTTPHPARNTPPFSTLRTPARLTSNVAPV